MATTSTETQQQLNETKIYSLKDLALRALSPREGKRVGFFHEMKAPLPAPMSPLWQEMLARLLHCAGFGLREEAATIFKDYPGILLWRGNLTDFSGKTYENITAFEYAVKAKDACFIEHVVCFLEHYSGQHKIALAQELIEQFSGSFNENRLDSVDKFIKAVAEWCKEFPTLFWSEPDATSDSVEVQDWDNYVSPSYQHIANGYQRCVELVGGAQAQFEAHILQRYCNLESFYPLPTFNETSLPEQIQIVNWYSEQNEPLIPVMPPGAARTFIIVRAGWSEGAHTDRVRMGEFEDEIATDPEQTEFYDDLTFDCEALDALDKARTAQLLMLKARLELIIQPENRPETEAEPRHFTPVIHF
ncbi:hypothetical protein [Legionella sp. CNM-4043-24]|uniref:hypothetical protein n=1 Tax=Legionella sp. CNM-4043-24 TaxID=3421646 RepID=UPI00403AB796